MSQTKTNIVSTNPKYIVKSSRKYVIEMKSKAYEIKSPLQEYEKILCFLGNYNPNSQTSKSDEIVFIKFSNNLYVRITNSNDITYVRNTYSYVSDTPIGKNELKKIFENTPEITIV